MREDCYFMILNPPINLWASLVAQWAKNPLAIEEGKGGGNPGGKFPQGGKRKHLPCNRAFVTREGVQ